MSLIQSEARGSEWIAQIISFMLLCKFGIMISLFTQPVLFVRIRECYIFTRPWNPERHQERNTHLEHDRNLHLQVGIRDY